jgi:putative oxidoreductase
LPSGKQDSFVGSIFKMRDLTDLIGRIFLSAIFIFEAIDSALYVDKTKVVMSRYGINWNQDLLLYGAIILLTLGGLMVLIGYRTTLGSVMLLIYWVPVTFLVHDFWSYPTQEVRMQSILFMKDVGIIGGLLMLIGKGSGRYSIKRILATTKVG